MADTVNEGYLQTLTQLLRESDEPLWRRIRELHLKKNLKPEELILVDCFPDDDEFEFGIVLTKEKEVFQFGFSYSDRPVSEGEFLEWKNITNTWQASPYHKLIELSMKMLKTDD
ncbi:MAG: hypothetical protein R3D55_03575 [Chloroflexota bacterium]